MSKVSDPFMESIKNYLEKRAAEDELFAVTYKKQNKNLQECCNYVMKCAKDGGCAGYTDAEVFSWAVHYYDEDDIKNIAPVSGKVIVNHAVEISEEEKVEAKQKALEELKNEAKEEAKKTFSETIELSSDDLVEAKQKAIEKVALEQKEKLLKKTAKKKVETTEVQQIGLF